MLTPSQLKEMRRCVVGPCSEAEKQELREGLTRNAEFVEPRTVWNRPEIWTSIAFYPVVMKWDESPYTPTITAADFIAKYLKP